MDYVGATRQYGPTSHYLIRILSQRTQQVVQAIIIVLPQPHNFIPESSMRLTRLRTKLIGHMLTLEPIEAQ
jgi:hypothetical protein